MKFLMVIKGRGECCGHGLGNERSEEVVAESWDAAVEYASEVWQESDEERIGTLYLAEVKKSQTFDADPGEGKEEKQLRKLKERLGDLELELRKRKSQMDKFAAGVKQATGVDIRKALEEEGTATPADIIANVLAETVRLAKQEKKP